MIFPKPFCAQHWVSKNDWFPNQNDFPVKMASQSGWLPSHFCCRMLAGRLLDELPGPWQSQCDVSDVLIQLGSFFGWEATPNKRVFLTCIHTPSNNDVHQLFKCPQAGKPVWLGRARMVFLQSCSGSKPQDGKGHEAASFKTCRWL